MAFNRKRTEEEFGYDLDLSAKRRTAAEIAQTGDVKRKNLKVVDNCPECNVERKISLNASRKNKPCLKCFHNSEKMTEIKKNQSKFVSEETKQRMVDNHWSKNGGEIWNKGKTNS